MKKMVKMLMTVLCTIFVIPFVSNATQVTTENTVRFEKEIYACAYDETMNFEIVGAEFNQDDVEFIYDGDEFYQEHYYKWNEFTLSKKKGTATMKAVVNGQTISCKVVVTHPKVKKYAYTLKKGQTIKISLTGLNEKYSNVTFKSKQPKIASVTEDGKVKALKNGTAEIEFTADYDTFTVKIIVEKGKKYKILKFATDNLGAKYSMSKRMKKGYFDCSSLVYRAYKAGGITLKGTTSQTIANGYKGKQVVGYGSVKSSKLKPGDIVCYGTYDKRTKAVNSGHVMIYIGHNSCIEASSLFDVSVCSYLKEYVAVVIRP